MALFMDQLQKYAEILGEKNKNPFIQIELGCHIMKCLKPRLVHCFVNRLAEMIYQKRKHSRPNDDQESDWLLSERLFYNKFVGEGILMLCMKYVLLAAYCDCLESGLKLPSIDGAIQNQTISDEKLLQQFEALTRVQCEILFYVACQTTIDDNKLEFFLRRDIAELYLENESEVLEAST